MIIALLPLADPSGEAAKAGPLAILVIALVSIACYFLFRSLSRHLRKVREGFPGESGVEDDAGARPRRPRPGTPGQ